MEIKNNKYKHYTAVNRAQLEKLLPLTNNLRYAQVLDQFIFWSVNSTLIRPGDNRTDNWFSIPYKTIAEKLSYSERTIKNIIKKFKEKGLINQVNKKFNNDKRSFIQVTTRVLETIGLITEKGNPTLAPKKVAAEKNLAQHCTSESAKRSLPFIRNKELVLPKNNSTVSEESSVNNFIKTTKALNPNTAQDLTFNVEKLIGEQLTTRFCNYIKGTLSNLLKTKGVKISNPEQLFAEIVYAITNKAQQFKGINDEHHCVNIIASLIRKGIWKTPKGFFKHSAIGKYFLEKQQAQEFHWQQQKLAETKAGEGAQDEGAYKPHYQDMPKPSNLRVTKDNIAKLRTNLRDVIASIRDKTSVLKQTEQFYEFNKLAQFKKTIDETAISLAKLYQQKEEIDLAIKEENSRLLALSEKKGEWEHQFC